MSDWLRPNWSCLDTTRTVRQKGHNRRSTDSLFRALLSSFLKRLCNMHRALRTETFCHDPSNKVRGRLRLLRYALAQRANTLRPEDTVFAAAPSNEPAHMTPPRRYLLISPCRDEAQYLRRTLDSVAAQSMPPALWVIVDDGSTDETPAILEEYASRLPYLRVVRRTDRGRRAGRAGRHRGLLRRPRDGRAWRTSTTSASWTWISTCRLATSSC